MANAELGSLRRSAAVSFGMLALPGSGRLAEPPGAGIASLRFAFGRRRAGRRLFERLARLVNAVRPLLLFAEWRLFVCLHGSSFRQQTLPCAHGAAGAWFL